MENVCKNISSQPIVLFCRSCWNDFAFSTTTAQLFSQSLSSHTLCCCPEFPSTANNFYNCWRSKFEQINIHAFRSWDNIFTQEWECGSPYILCKCTKSPPTLSTNTSKEWNLYLSWSYHLVTFLIWKIWTNKNENMLCWNESACSPFPVTTAQLFSQSPSSHTFCSCLDVLSTTNNLCNFWRSKFQQVSTYAFCSWDDIFTQNWNCSSPNNLCKCTEAPPTLPTKTSIEWNWTLDAFLNIKTRRVIPIDTRGNFHRSCFPSFCENNEKKFWAVSGIAGC